MGFRVQKRIKIAPGVRVSLTGSKRGLTSGVSVGPKGAKVSVNSRGRQTTTLGVPGTGISRVSTSQGAATSFGPMGWIVLILICVGLGAVLLAK
ncbi:DUF4236 domain-containing protein [Phenylobacterium sp.]|uniref:DUF4236 domain-containing protein n=1 Tax=Phenylobacterium sp. TaxID=1871053 RepID=UPI0035C7AC1C